LRRIAAKLLNQVRLWRDRADGRERLANLSERDLRDIGVTRHEADLETRKPFWKE
jgi:uncharacterized protein YjiS (DUF1127 family)